jgi:hypothetical protein
MSSALPKLVGSLTHLHDAWIVGGAANPNNKSPRDWDVLVPYSSWQAASGLIPSDAKPNRFGGWKCRSNGYDVDVWPGELSWLIQHPKCIWIWQPRIGVRFKKV